MFSSRGGRTQHLLHSRLVTSKGGLYCTRAEESVCMFFRCWKGIGILETSGLVRRRHQFATAEGKSGPENGQKPCHQLPLLVLFTHHRETLTSPFAAPIAMSGYAPPIVSIPFRGLLPAARYLSGFKRARSKGARGTRFLHPLPCALLVHRGNVQVTSIGLRACQHCPVLGRNATEDGGCCSLPSPTGLLRKI